jgi:hypothetical protein
MSLEHTYSVDGTVTHGMVRRALGEVEKDDISQSSPITAGVPEAGIVITQDTVIVTVEGHEGDWTKTSETALRRAVKSVDDVEALEESEGGYEA